MHSAVLTHAGGIRVHRVESVLIRVPAHQDYLGIVRSAVAQLGAQRGYTVAEIADLRLAVDEACCLLVDRDRRDGRAGRELECRVQVGTDTLKVVVAGGAAGVGAPDTEGLGWIILEALVDTVSWSCDGDTARIDLLKRRLDRSR